MLAGGSVFLCGKKLGMQLVVFSFADTRKTLCGGLEQALVARVLPNVTILFDRCTGAQME